MPQIIGQRSTLQVNSGNEDRLIRRVDAEIAMLEPNEAPLVTLYNKLNKRKGIDRSEFEWYEDDYCARWAQNSGVTVAALTTATTVTVVDATLFVPGDMVAIPRAVNSSTPPEIIRVIAPNYTTNVLTVVRAVGGSTVGSIDADAAMTIIGSAYEEGALPPEAKKTKPVKRTNYLQIFRSTVKITKTANANAVYGAASGDRRREHAKKMKEHKINMNRALLFGKASQDYTGGPTGQPLRTTDGILNVISTNKTDAGGTVDFRTFENFARQSFRYGSQDKVLLCAPIIKSAIDSFAKNHIMLAPGSTKFGLNIQRLETAHGNWIILKDWMLEDGVAGKNGFGGMALSLDMDEFEYRYLSNNGENRDTHVMMDVVKDGRDAYVDEILTEAGFQVKREKFHALLYNVVDYTS